MKRHIVSLLILISICACTIVNDPSSATKSTPVIVSSPLPQSTELSTTLTASPSFPLNYSIVELECDKFLEASWGKELAQWGGPPTNAFPLLTFDDQKGFYLPDYLNHRLLYYNGSDKIPVRTIELSEKLFEGLPGPYMPVFANHKIFIPYGFDRIAILSKSGEWIKDIQLPYGFPIIYDLWNYVLVDQYGGIFANISTSDNSELAYFKAGWEDGVWNKLTGTSQIERRIILWNNNYASQEIKPAHSEQVDQTGSSTKDWQSEFYVTLRRFDPEKDFLNETPEYISTGLKENGYSLQAIDGDGWIYIDDNVPSTIIRYSISREVGQVGKLPDDLHGTVMQTNIAPDGTIYLIVYDRETTNLKPQIVECRFP
jgi:hypothetical protein